MLKTPYFRELISVFPNGAAELFSAVAEKIDADRSLRGIFGRAVKDYMGPRALPMRKALERVEKTSPSLGVSPYTTDFIFVMKCTEILKNRYAEAGVEDSVFFASMDDLRCKLLECMECKGVPGTFVADWYDGFLKMRRFAYGRFQYEVAKSGFSFTSSCGKVIKESDPVVNFHIPSSGVPLSDSVRLASYREAWPHYRHLSDDGRIVFKCHSWLLYPEHRLFLPKGSNILRFLDDFEIVSWVEKDSFDDAWRVFGRYAALPPEQLPRDTSLRRAFADRLASGGKTGCGCGIIVFDGEKIVR